MRETSGIYGGRFSGAGFKGCCMTLVNPEKVDSIREEDEAKLRRAGVFEVDGEKLISFEEKLANPRSHWCAPPFYYYTATDVEKIPKAIEDGCATDAPGSLVA